MKKQVKMTREEKKARERFKKACKGLRKFTGFKTPIKTREHVKLSIEIGKVYIYQPKKLNSISLRLEQMAKTLNSAL